MENNHPNTPSGGRAPKQFSEVPASRKAADMVQWLEEHKALRVVCIDLEGQGGFADALIIEMCIRDRATRMQVIARYAPETIRKPL